MNHPQAKNPARGPIRKSIASRNHTADKAGVAKPQVSVQKGQMHAAVQSTLMALEPRMLFDGAAIATGADAIDQTSQPTELNQQGWSEALREAAVAYEINNPTQATALLVIDQSVEGWQQLIQGRAANTDVLILDRDQDGLAQIAGAVAQYSNLQSIQIVSHGDQGVISLGNRLVSEISLDQSAGALSAIGGALSKDGDILLYGCEVGSGAKGAAFLQALARSTQADIAASTDLTGAASLGGNWDLETTVGSVEAGSVLSTAALEDYSQLLDALPVNNGGSRTISGHLWDDTLTFDNLIGGKVPGPEENCFADVTVQLIWAGADGVFGIPGDPASDDVIYTTQTGDSNVPGESDGTFQFTGLADGYYKLVVPNTFNDPLSKNVKLVSEFEQPTGSDGVVEILINPSLPVVEYNFGYVQINDAPKVTIPPDQQILAEDVSFTFSGAASFSISDPGDMNTAVDSFNRYLTTLTVDSGTLTLAAQAGVTVVGSGSGLMTLEGTIANINAALLNLSYKANTDFTGYDYLKIRVDDRGNFGDAANGNCIPNEAADNLFGTAQIDLCVLPVNDPPVAINDANQTTSIATTPITGNVARPDGKSPGDNPDTDPEGNLPLVVCGVAVGVMDPDPAVTPSGNVGTDLQGMYGTLRVNADGTYSYLVNTSNPIVASLPSLGTITDTFTYCVADTLGDKAKAQLVITITGQGRPVAAPDTNSTVEDSTTPATGNVLGVAPGRSLGDRTDTDPDGDLLTVCGVVAGTPAGVPVGSVGSLVAGTYGSVTINANGTYSYQVNNADTRVQALDATTPPLTDVFTYCVSDGKGGVDKTTLTITITGINDAPKANPDTNSTVVGSPTPVSGNVLGGLGRVPTDVTDTDPENDPLTVCGVVAGNSATVPSVGVGLPVDGNYGTIRINANGTYTYVVDPADPAVVALTSGATLTDVFTYCVSDGKGGFDKTTLTITITGPNSAPDALPDTNSTIAGATTPAIGNVLGGIGKAPTDVTDTDPENDPLTVCGVLAGNSSSTPTGNVGSPVIGTYGTVTINANGTYSYQVDNSNPLVANLPVGSTLTDVFSYCATDSKSGTDKTTLTITITGSKPVNDPPVAKPDGNSTTADSKTPTTGNVIGGPGKAPTDVTDTDPNNDPLAVCGIVAGNSASVPSTGVGSPIVGTFGTVTLNADGTYSYQVDRTNQTVLALQQGQTVSDVFTYCLTDGKGGFDKTTLTITITGVNDCPVAVSDGNTVNAANGAATRGNAIGGPNASVGDRADTDPDGDALRVCGVAAGNVAGPVSGNVGGAIMGQYGSLTVNADGSYSYVVDASKPGVVALRPGQTLTDTFTYCVTDGVCDPQKAQIVITLNGVNDPPTARGTPEVAEEGGMMRCDLAVVSDAEDAPAQLSVKIDAIANSASGTFFYREPIAGQPGQFREVPVTAGMTITGEQLAQLCFKANPQTGALRGPDGALLPPTLAFTVTDTSGAQASSSTTIVIKPPVRVETPPVAPREVPPIAVVPPLLIPPAIIPTIDGRPLAPIVVPPLNLAPALDPVSLFDPTTTLAEAPLPPDRAVKSAAVSADEKPVAKVDDCIPTVKPKVKMKAVKRSVFADSAQKPMVAFSEQVKEAKKRFKLPAKVAPRPASAKEC
jgi:VCBS repeat-containing protein